MVFFDMAAYDEGAGAPVTLADFGDRPAFIGVDMGSVQDLAALLAVAKTDDGGWIIWARQYCPADQIRKRSAAGLPYAEWVERGELIATPGNVIDQEVIENDIAEICSELDIRKIAVDRWGSIGFMTRLGNRGLPVVQFGQGFASMSAPCKEIERTVLARKFRHGGNALLRWNFSNVRPETDAAANLKFSKSKQAEKCDGAVACAMAIGVALADDGEDFHYPLHFLGGPDDDDFR